MSDATAAVTDNAGPAAEGPHSTANGTAAPHANGVELSGFGALGAWRRRTARAPLTAEEGLKHLVLSVDVDTLYRCPRKHLHAICMLLVGIN